MLLLPRFRVKNQQKVLKKTGMLCFRSQKKSAVFCVLNKISLSLEQRARLEAALEDQFEAVSKNS